MSAGATAAAGEAAADAGRGMLRRFLRLLGATGLEGALASAFLLFLAWRDSGAYGALMYGLAGALLVGKVVQFGLYYPLVVALGHRPHARHPPLLAAVALFRMLLGLACLVAVAAFARWRALPAAMAFPLVLLSAGFVLEEVAATAFARLRLLGRQHVEARCRVWAALLGYGYAFAAVALGAPAPLVACFKPLAAFVLLAAAWRGAGLRWAKPAAGELAATRRPLRPLLAAGLTLGAVDLLGTTYNKTNVFFLEAATGAAGVALYSATWSVVDAVSVLVSEQLLSAVVFPGLTLAWAANRDRALGLVRRQAGGLLYAAGAAMLLLYEERSLIIDLLYPAAYAPAAEVQRYLVASVGLSFASNLWASLMIVAGAGRVLLGFAALATAANLGLCAALVPPLGLVGACHALVLTKLLVAALTTAYCQARFRVLPLRQVLSAAGGVLAVLAAYVAGRAALPQHAAVALGCGLFALLSWRAFRAPRAAA